jgi:hypothetical protein
VEGYILWEVELLTWELGEDKPVYWTLNNFTKQRVDRSSDRAALFAVDRVLVPAKSVLKWCIELNIVQSFRVDSISERGVIWNFWGVVRSIYSNTLQYEGRFSSSQQHRNSSDLEAEVS